jgi:hypothetical protein
MLFHVCFHWPHTSIPIGAGVRKGFCQAVIQQAGFAGIKQNRSSVREGLSFWTTTAMAGFYTYPELTPCSASRCWQQPTPRWSGSSSCTCSRRANSSGRMGQKASSRSNSSTPWPPNPHTNRPHETLTENLRHNPFYPGRMSHPQLLDGLIEPCKTRNRSLTSEAGAYRIGGQIRGDVGKVA